MPARSVLARASWRRFAAGCALLLVAGFALPARARADCGVRAPLVGWQLAVHLSHGYCLTATPADASPFGGGAQLLIVQTTKGTLTTGFTRIGYPFRSARWGDQWTSLALARAGNWLSLDLGARGKLAVRFYPSHTVSLPPSGGCAGDAGRELIGVWKGTISFTGEHGYASVRTRSAPGTVVLKQPKASDPGCGEPETVSFTDIPGPITATAFILEVTNAGSTALFGAYMVQEATLVEFKAEAARRPHQSGCSVERLAATGALAPGAGLDWSAENPPGSASVTPPAPFTGSGSYANGTLSGTISFYCPNEHRSVPVPSPAAARASFFP